MNEEQVLIEDTRDIANLGINTISGYHRSKVKSALKKAMKDADIEPACYWSAELICSLRPEDVWEEIIAFYADRVNLASLNVAIYIAERINNFKCIAVEVDEIDLRNNYDVRRIFAEVMAVVVFSRRRQPLRSCTKLSRTSFEMAEISPFLRADKSTYATKFGKENDPSDIYIPLNELTFHLGSQNGDAYLACYWIDWLLTYTALMKKDKKNIKVQKRDWPLVQERYAYHPIWAAWDCILGVSKIKSSKLAKVVSSLTVLFCLRFKDNSAGKRRQLLYTGIFAVIDEPRQYPPLCSNMQKVNRVKDRIDLIYKQVKSNKNC